MNLFALGLLTVTFGTTSADVGWGLAPAWVDDHESRADSLVDPRWYGWKIMLADALSTGVFVVGLEANGGDGHGVSWPLFLGGLGSYALTPAVIHGLNDGGAGRVAGSLGLRLVCPALGFLLGMAALHPNDDFGGGPAGFVLGAGLAMVLDWTALSWKPPAPPHAATGAVDSLWLAPTVDQHGQLALALGGRW